MDSQQDLPEPSITQPSVAPPASAPAVAAEPAKAAKALSSSDRQLGSEPPVLVSFSAGLWGCPNRGGSGGSGGSGRGGSDKARVEFLKAATKTNRFPERAGMSCVI